MKRKFAAMVLGMAVTLTSMGSVYAAETEAVILEEVNESAAAVEENAEEETSIAIWGEVMSVDEESITLATGTLTDSEESVDAKAAATEVNAEGTAAEAEVTEAAAEDTDAGENVSSDEAVSSDEIQVTLLPDEEEMTIAITENTQVYLVYGDTTLETLEEVTAEFAGEEITEDTETNVAAGMEISDEAEESEDEATENEQNAVSVDVSSIDSILEGDLAGIILDEEENAETILIVLPESELITEVEETE